jgi:hypothetical protein
VLLCKGQHHPGPEQLLLQQQQLLLAVLLLLLLLLMLLRLVGWQQCRLTRPLADTLESDCRHLTAQARIQPLPASQAL